MLHRAASGWISFPAVMSDSKQVMGLLSHAAITVVRSRKAAHYGSLRGLDEVIMRDIGFSLADLYVDKPRDDA